MEQLYARPSDSRKRPNTSHVAYSSDSERGKSPRRRRGRAKTAYDAKVARLKSVVSTVLDTHAYPEHGLLTIDHSRTPAATSRFYVEAGVKGFDKGVNFIERFLSTTEGRDKLFKILQYGSQCLAHLCRDFTSTIGGRSISDRFRVTRKSTSLARKYLKLASALTFMKLTLKILRLEQEPIKRTVTVGRMMGLAGYFWLDHIGWLIRIGWYDGNKLKVARTGLTFQLLSLTCTFALDCMIICELWRERKLIHKERKAERHRTLSKNPHLAQAGAEYEVDLHSVRLSAMRSKWQSLKVTFFKNICDLVGCLNVVFQLQLNDGIVGGLGTLSAIIGIRRFYARLKQEEAKDAKNS